MFLREERSRPGRWALLSLPAIFVILIILGAPGVADIHPEPEAGTIPASTRIRLTFNRPMDRISVETRITVTPAHQGHFQWDGLEMTYIPDEPWPEGEEITFTLGAGARSNTFLPILRGHQWTFRIGVPRIIYLWPVDGPGQLYSQNLDGGDSAQLTDTDLGVLDYSLSSDSSWAVYSTLGADGRTGLHLLDLIEGDDRVLYRCPSGTRCQMPRLSPDMKEIAFEQLPSEPGSGGAVQLGSPQIWRASIDDEDPQAFSIGTPGHSTSSASWTPHGHLAYYDEDEKQFYVVDPMEGPATTLVGNIPSELGEMGTWSIDGTFMVFPDLVFLQESYERYAPTGDEFPLFFSHIYQQGVTSGLVEDLSNTESELVEDASPVYSPDGKLIAFTRKYLQGERWTQGRQVWVMDADGRQPQQITDEAIFNHGELSWSPDGSKLAFLKTNQVDLAEAPEIWVYELENEQLTYILSGGYSPKWIQ